MAAVVRAVARWVLWALLGLVAVRGVASFVWPAPAPPPPVVAPGEPPDPWGEAARAYAVLFVHEYLTWRAEDPWDHAARLRPYLRSGLDEHGGWVPGPGVRDQQVLGAWVYGYRVAGPERRLVTVAARVAVGGPGPAARVLYVQVPVAVGPVGLAVDDLPAFVPGPLQAREAPAGPGQEVEAPAELAALAEGFLRAYVGGRPGEMAYFWAPGSAPPAPLGGNLVWQGLVGVKLYRQGDQQVAVAEGAVLDPATGATLRQRWRLRVVRDGRWYVAGLE